MISDKSLSMGLSTSDPPHQRAPAPQFSSLEVYHYDPSADSTLEMTLEALCERLVSSPVLSNLTIVRMDWMKEASAVKHEYLVLEYCLPSVPHMPPNDRSARHAFLRLDRMPVKTLQKSSGLGDGFRFFSRGSSGVFPVKDSVSTNQDPTLNAGSWTSI